jgi:RNA polymerase sigma factor (sigma-70 family)
MVQEFGGGRGVIHEEAGLSKASDAAEWPPDSLSEYYRCDAFLRHIKILQRRLEKTYPNADAESVVFDAAADLLVKEIRKQLVYDKFLHRFPTERHFLRYLYRMCCRKVIDNNRSFQRRFRQLLDADDVQDTAIGPEEAVIGWEKFDETFRVAKDLEKTVIAKLPKMDRLILKHRLAGRTFSEIADLLELGVATVHRRYKVVISKLASHLESQGKEKNRGPRNDT